MLHLWKQASGDPCAGRRKRHKKNARSRHTLDMQREETRERKKKKAPSPFHKFNSAFHRPVSLVASDRCLPRRLVSSMGFLKTLKAILEAFKRPFHSAFDSSKTVESGTAVNPGGLEITKPRGLKIPILLCYIYLGGTASC